jgi:MFS superfamily sulfate permease-like transporter
MGVKTVGFDSHRAPPALLPDVRLRDTDGLLGLALACFFLSYIEAFRARAFGSSTDIRDPNQELLALEQPTSRRVGERAILWREGCPSPR